MSDLESGKINLSIEESPASIISKDLEKVIFSRILLINTEITPDNIQDKLLESQSLLNKSLPLTIKFIRHLIGLLTIDIQSNTVNKSSTAFLLLRDIFRYLAKTAKDRDPVVLHFHECFEDHPILRSVSVKEFFDQFSLPIFEKVYLSLLLTPYLPKGQFEFLQDTVPALSEFIEQDSEIYSIAFQEGLKKFLLLFLESDFFSLYPKLIIFAKATKLLSNTPDSFVRPITFRFLSKLEAMSVREIFSEINPSELAPSDMLSAVLSFQRNEKLTDAVVFLLTEIIAPTSQSLNGTEHTSLTSPDIVQSTAKGSSMQQIFNKLEIHWENVMDQLVNKSLKDNYKLTAASLSQFLSSVPISFCDLFFSNLVKSVSLSSLQEQVIIGLHELKLYSSSGGIDIFELNLEPVVPNMANLRESIIYFLNIAKLEIRTIANLQKFQKLVSNDLNKYFHEDFTDAPDYLAVGAISLLGDDKVENEDPCIAQIAENLIIPLLDINSVFLPIIFKKLAAYDPSKLARVCKSYFEANGPNSINKIIKTLPLELVELILDSLDSPDSLVLFILSAGKVGYSNAGDYLAFKLKSYDDNEASKFIESFLTIITAEIDYSQDPTYLERIPLTLAYDLMTLFDNSEISNLIGRFQALERYNELQVKFLQSFPRLSNFGFGHDEAILRAEENSRSFPPDIELKMKNYFEQMYSRHFEIKDITDLLSKLKVSDSPQDQDLFACMLHSIIDEYRFYPTYPTEAIALTSVLFGSLIFFRLFEGTTLKIALRYILDSARMPPESNMFKFAVQALFACRARLSEYKSYCAALASIENLKSHVILYNDIAAISDGTYTVTTSNTPLPTRASTGEGKEITSKYNSFFISKLQKNVDQTLPSEEISESLSFLLNNLSLKNFETTVVALKEKVSQNLYEYFANTLVINRAKLEPNYHDLYSRIVQSFDSKLFDDYVLNTSLVQSISILNNDEPSDTERQHLKNLGSWLGLITLKRNKAIKNSNVLFELLLVEAYDSKKLPIVLPFVSKVVASTKDSVIFKYPNPWVYGIVQVLKELYEFGDLALNLKFEIEVLCNLLKISIEEIEASVIIRNHPPNYASDLRAEFEIGRQEAKQALFSPPLQMQEQSQFISQQQQQQKQQHPTSTLSSSFDVSSAFESVVGQSHNPIFLQSENIKSLFQYALTRAVKEMLPTFVERINAIAIHSSRTLVLKDFALDPDEAKLFNSAHQLLTNLVDSLAPVQCRDNLKQTILIVVRATLGDDFVVVEEQLSLAAEEITPIGIELIKATALKSAIAELEKMLTPNYMARRSYRGSTQQFVDVGVASRYAIGLPEPLGLKAGGVTAQQYAVYENFGRQSLAISRNNQLSLLHQAQQQRASELFEQPHEEQSANMANNHLPIVQQTPLVDPSQQIQQQQFNQPQVLESMLEQTLEKILRETLKSPLTSIEELTDDNPIKFHIAQVLAFCLRTPQKDSALLTLAQLVVQALFTLSEKKLTSEVFVSLLESACAFSPSALYDVSHWFVQVYDDRKFNKDVLLCLWKSGGLITSIELDNSLAGYILQKNETATLFAIDLISTIIEANSIHLLRCEFIAIIAALKVSDSQDANALFFMMSQNKVRDGVTSEEEYGYIFAQWVKICQHDLLPNASEIRKVFVKQLLDTNIFSKTENVVPFMRMAIEISVIAFNKENESKRTKVDFYLTTDALADLIMEILINIEDDDQFTQRSVVLDVILSVLVVYFASDHKNLKSFNQRPYFRIFSSILSNFSEYVSKNAEYSGFESKFYLTLAEKFISMQPIAFPGFTFAWMTLISHRLFLPKILQLEAKAGWANYIALLTALLNFQSTYVTSKQVPDMLVLVYKGTLRIFLLLLHDFPELLVENHYLLTVNIPLSFVQLRNIVLSAFPRGMSFPDPFQPGLKIERIPEISESPKVCYNPSIDLENASKSLKKNIDTYMRVPSKPIMKNIISALTLPESKNEGGIGFATTKYNLKLVNALVLYIGMIAVNEKQSTFTTNSDECICLKDLMLEAPIELQYQLFEAITNQLRYPNAHTHWFSCVIIYFFSSQSLWGDERENVQQIITRVLLERTIANRPHPWGLLITFTELLKNSEYAFFDLPFTKCAPEFKTLFGSLLRHISSTGSTAIHTPTV